MEYCRGPRPLRAPSTEGLIVRAACEVCGEASDVDLEGKNDVRQCRADTVAAATAQRQKLVAIARTGAPIIVAAR